MKHYAKHNFSSIDPVTRQVLTKRTPFFWSDVTSRLDRISDSHRMMDQAADAGLGDGIGISLRGGRFKTALASLLQQHFGAGFAAHRLPGSWASMANFNEVLAFIAKDALVVIDDFRPCAAERRRLDPGAILPGPSARRPGLGDLPRLGSMRPSLRSVAKDAENRFHRCGDRAMSVHDGRGNKPLPEKEISLEH
jgi:hypothetical protein